MDQIIPSNLNDRDLTQTPISTANDAWISSSSGVPVEIWYKILRIAISFPLLPRDDDGYPTCEPAFLFDCSVIAKYKVCERDRAKLQLVCRSWNSFLDNYSNRLVHFTTRAPNGHWPPVKHWDRVVRIQGSNVYCDCTPEPCWPSPMYRSRKGRRVWNPKALPPPEVLIQKVKNDYIPQLRGQLKAIANASFWVDQLVDQDLLGGVSMLTVAADFPHRHRASSIEITRAYRNLTHLQLLLRRLVDPDNYFDLPKLRYLYLNFMEREPSNPGPEIGHWRLPSLQILRLQMNFTDFSDMQPTLSRLIGLVGRRVEHFAFEQDTRYAMLPEATLSSELWMKMPELKLLGLQVGQLVNLPIPEDASKLSLGINICDTLVGLGKESLVIDDIHGKWFRIFGGLVILDQPWRDFFEDVKTGRYDSEIALSDCAKVFDVLDLIGSGIQDSEGVGYDERVRMQICLAVIRDAQT